MQVDVNEYLDLRSVEQVQPGAWIYTHSHGWTQISAVHVPPCDDLPTEPTVLDLAEEKDGVTSLRFPPMAFVLCSWVYQPDQPDPEPEPAAGHFVWRDAGTGEFVDEAYAEANPDATVKEWVDD